MVEQILNYRKSPEDDLYNIIGCDPSATIEQIMAEFKVRAKKFHPDKNPGEGASQEFSRLQRAKEILCNEDSRYLYDKWKGSGIAMCFDEWTSRRETTNMATHWWNTTKTQPMLLSEQTPKDATQTVGTVNWKSESTPIREQFRSYQI